MTGRERIRDIIRILEETYPGPLCSLSYEKPYELLIAVRLSAQCTDARVNLVAPRLFERYPTLDALAGARPEDVEKIIYSCGFYHAKAKDIIGMCRMLLSDYGGVVPDSIGELTKLPGVGRKTANLICGDVYHQPAYVCDTHCIRITNLLGLTHSRDAFRAETELRGVIPPDKSSDFCHRMVLLGRDICTARKPRCTDCPLSSLCEGRSDPPQGSVKQKG